MRKPKLYFDTIWYLKPKQLLYQLFYRIKRTFANNQIEKSLQFVQTHELSLDQSIPSSTSYLGDHFIFLNREKRFDKKIEWNFEEYGKLWVYNLNYFDYLNQLDIDEKVALEIIDSFCEKPYNRKQGAEPYPTSLRGINWIKFFSKRKIANPKYDAILFAHYRFLAANVEYHLMGNHLLENGFSLLFSAYYFRDVKFYVKAENILRSELKEQVLHDGGHFELSPMYHQILLFRLLDCINLTQNNSWKNDSLLTFLKEKASLMLGWLKEVTFLNGDIPMVNDSAYGIGPTSEALFDYASRLKIIAQNVPLSDSGYKMIRLGSYELFLDLGNIGPDYIPGHAHSDTFNFVLHYNGFPLIVDTGTSTYDIGQQRHLERSTTSHNTVKVNDQEQTEVWASFRVGRRAKIIERLEIEKQIISSHNGYKFLGLIHTRTWQWDDQKIILLDKISGKNLLKRAVSFVHFHPLVDVKIENDVVFAGPLRIACDGKTSLRVEDYSFAEGFNKTAKGKVLKIYFDETLKTEISFSV